MSSQTDLRAQNDEIACEIVRNVCETEPADPDAPMTVCIDVTRLREIVDSALLTRTEADEAATVGAVDPQDLTRWLIDKLCGFDRKRYDLPVVTMDVRTAFSMLPRLFTHPQEASAGPVLFGRDSGGDWYMDEDTKTICVDIDFDPARQLSILLKQDGAVSWSIFVQEPDSSTVKATGQSVMNPGFYQALGCVALPSPPKGE